MKTKILLSLLTLIVIFFTGLFFYVKPYYDFLTGTLKISLAKTLFTNGSLQTHNGQVNTAILGIGGGNHDGPNLSDSIIVASYNFQTNRLTTISIPRDIWSNTLKDKINSAYAYGGMDMAKTELSAVVGMPIQYAAIIDFSKFEELINFLGGVDVNVENSFTDHLFPIPGKENDPCGGDPQYSCRYETISFTKGITHMDGVTALNFVRSRHAEGEEGTDFAREKRQQLVIAAVKNKIIAMARQHKLTQLKALYQLVNQVVKRDITNQQAAIIGKNIILKNNFQQNSVVLTEDFFDVPDYSPTYKEMWVLIPTDKNFTIIHKYIDCYLNARQNCESLKPTPTPTP